MKVTLQERVSEWCTVLHSPSGTRPSQAAKEKPPRAGVNPKESRKCRVVAPESSEEALKVNTKG